MLKPGQLIKIVSLFENKKRPIVIYWISKNENTENHFRVKDFVFEGTVAMFVSIKQQQYYTFPAESYCEIIYYNKGFTESGFVFIENVKSL